MSIRTPTEYVDGLKDSREVFYRGGRVSDVTANSELRLAIDHSALAYSIAQSHPNLAVDSEGVKALAPSIECRGLPTTSDIVVRQLRK
jgi:aromatic ring hydroxylase